MDRLKMGAYKVSAASVAGMRGCKSVDRKVVERGTRRR